MTRTRPDSPPVRLRQRRESTAADEPAADPHSCRMADFRPFLGSWPHKSPTDHRVDTHGIAIPRKTGSALAFAVRSAREPVGSREVVTFSCGHRPRGPPDWRAAERRGET